VGNETNSITGIVAGAEELGPGASPTPELGPGMSPSTGSRCCVGEVEFDDRALLISKLLTFWVDGFGG